MKQVSIILGFLLLFTGNLMAAVRYNLYQQKNTSFDYNLLYNKHSQSNLAKQEQASKPIVQSNTIEQSSEFRIKADAILDKAKALTNYYKNSGRHYIVFKTFYKEVEQNPTETNIAELEFCYNLLRKYHTDRLDYKSLDAQLKNANDITTQEQILINEAKKQANTIK